MTEKPRRGRPPNADARTRSITIRMKPEVVERLGRAADERVVGRNLLIEKAIERYLDALEEMP